jgi:hypothetical protein
MHTEPGCIGWLKVQDSFQVVRYVERSEDHRAITHNLAGLALLSLSVVDRAQVQPSQQACRMVSDAQASSDEEPTLIVGMIVECLDEASRPGNPLVWTDVRRQDAVLQAKKRTDSAVRC